MSVTNKTIRVRCSGIGCEEEFEATFSSPEGWTNNSEYVNDIERSSPSWGWLCSKCLPQRDWFKSVCPGCVGSYSSGCDFERLVERGKELSEEALATIRSGMCPSRVNGTMMFDTAHPEQGITHTDISDKATTESGNAVADAIKEYL